MFYELKCKKVILIRWCTFYRKKKSFLAAWIRWLSVVGFGPFILREISLFSRIFPITVIFSKLSAAYLMMLLKNLSTLSAQISVCLVWNTISVITDKVSRAFFSMPTFQLHSVVQAFLVGEFKFQLCSVLWVVLMSGTMIIFVIFLIL